MKGNTHNFFYLFMVLVLFIVSCSNEVDINDEYKEISIAYALMNHAEDQHYVKLTKAFQTDGNVYLAAGEIANSQYDPADVDVWIEEYNAYGNFLKSISLDTILVTNKDSGAFYYPNQLIYATAKGIVLNQNNEYKLKAEVKSSGNLIEAKTDLVKDFNITKPPSLVKYLDYSGNYTHSVEWRSAENGKLYQLTIRYFYTDVPVSGPTSAHYVDWTFSQTRSDGTTGGEKMTYEFLGSTFYDILASEIPPAENGLVRWSDSLYYMFYVADENYTIYMDVNAPSNSIVQERPAYSNISNGLGLFSSRYNKNRFFEGLTQKSLDSLYNGSKTYDLGFEDRP